MPRYSKSAWKGVERGLQWRNIGALKSGSSGKAVMSRKQAIVIALSMVGTKGRYVPKRKSAY
jgi:hypothetical protein